jgi:hypothetical protein
VNLHALFLVGAHCVNAFCSVLVNDLVLFPSTPLLLSVRTLRDASSRVTGRAQMSGAPGQAHKRLAERLDQLHLVWNFIDPSSPVVVFRSLRSCLSFPTSIPVGLICRLLVQVCRQNLLGSAVRGLLSLVSLQVGQQRSSPPWKIEVDYSNYEMKRFDKSVPAARRCVSQQPKPASKLV